MRALAVLLACVLAGACGGSAPETGPSNAGTGGEPGQTADLEPQVSRGRDYVGTGETWAGEFVMGNATLTMTTEGDFTRVRPGGATDGGSYLVTEDGRLVLFVERVGDARLTTARPEVFPRTELVPTK